MRRRAIAALFAAAMTSGGVVASGGVASAKITPVETPVACLNPNGHPAPGQQPSCGNNRHQQIVDVENQNPSGHPPPGHNK